MKVFREGEPYDLGASAVALGNFDGLHIAHQRIIQNCIEYGRKQGIKSGVLLFDTHTEAVTAHAKVRLLTTLAEKLELLAAMGLDFAAILPFDETVRRMGPEAFIRLLRERLQLRAAAVGYDYRFGYQARGDVQLLRELADGYTVLETPAVRQGAQIVSSTLLRELVAGGAVLQAKQLLGRAYTVAGRVHPGLQNGRRMGIPTANLAYDGQKLLPGDGVYKGRTCIRGVWHLSLINVGKNPTFNAEKRTVESFILDFDGDLYAEALTVAFDEKMRDEIKFANKELLKQQIRQDIMRVKGESI